MSVHAHKILNKLAESAMTKDQIERWAIEEFGADASFRTCSIEGMSLSEVLEFFVARQKVTIQGDTWLLNQANVCSH
jgi:probable metal-binding protein